MVKKLGTIVFLLCVLTSFNVNGQGSVDSVRQLKEIVVTQSRLNDYVIAPFELPIDSAMLSLASNGSLTDLLRKQGLGHLRAYGPGGLALPSFRGSGSSHTAVLWNGITLVGPLTGQLDLSLIPVNLFNDVTIQTGGSTSLSGNGSIGANIHLNNDVNFGQGLQLNAAMHFGSFGNQYYDAGVKYSTNNFGMSTKVFFTAAENDFKYVNNVVFPPETQVRDHNAFQQQGLLQQLHWQLKKVGIVSLKFWYDESHYEVPNPTGIERPATATQDNISYRILGGWNFSRQSFDFNYQGAFIRQDLDYVDSVGIYPSRFNSTVQHAETNVYFNNQAQLTSGIQYTWEDGIAEEYGDTSPTRNRFAFFSAYKVRVFEKLDLAISAREEIVDSEAMPFSPALSLKYNFNTRLHVFTNLSRNYRIPTFNDLYWRGAGAQGNPDLKTETSVSAETGIGFTNPIVSFKSVVFTNHVDNWILWSQRNQVWSPQNVKKVWSRGVESQVTIAKKIGQVLPRLIGQYSFTKSTNEDIYANGNPNEKGKQLILTPVHEGSATVEIQWKKFALRVVNAYTGIQYNDGNNSPYNVIPDYLITNIWMSKAMEGKHVRVTLIAEINNALNVDYVARPGYPMPGRNYKAGVQFNFNKPIKA